MTREINLTVNDSEIKLDYFVAGFIDHTVTGMLAALEGTGQIMTAEINIDGTDVKVAVNDDPVAVNMFVAKILSSTLKGMVSSLKGVADIARIHLYINR